MERNTNTVRAFVKPIETKLMMNDIPKERFYRESGITTASMSQWRSGKHIPSESAKKKAEQFFSQCFEESRPERETCLEVKPLTREEENELEILKKSPYVALARKEHRLKYRRKQALYTLKNMEKRGKVLAEMGITFNVLEELERETERLIAEEEDNAKNET